MTRTARTSFLAVAGLVGALVGATPAQAVPEEVVPLFEPALTDSPQDIQPLGRTAAGMAWTEAYSSGLWVQPTGGEATKDDAFLFPEMVGDLITELSYDESTVTWRTVADAGVQVHEVPVGIRYEARTATGYVGVQGTGPYEVVHVDLLDGGALTVVGTSTTRVGYLVPSSVGVAAMTSNGSYRYFRFATPGTGTVVSTGGRYMECPWLSRAHLFCYSDTGISRISLSTGASTSASAVPVGMIETSTGVAFADESLNDVQSQTFVLKTWATSAAAPTVRVDQTFGLSGVIAPGGTASSILVGRRGTLGRAGIWSVPLPSGASTAAVVAAAEPRRAGWAVALAPGSVAWTDNSARSGNLWTRDLDADGTPIGENRLITDEADATTLSAGAGRFTYTANVPYGSEYYGEGTQLVDGDEITPIDDGGWTAVLSGDRLLTEEMSFFDEDTTWRLRDLRTGAVTALADAMDYDLWGERLVRLDESGQVRLYDLRTGGAPVELRAGSDDWLFGSVHIAGDVVAWDILDFAGLGGFTGERVTRNVETMAAAVPLPDDLIEVSDLSTGYVVGMACSVPEPTGPDDCLSEAIALDDGEVTDVGIAWPAVDGNVVAGTDFDGMPSVQTVPAYTDAPRLLAHPRPSTLAGPGRTWKARVVTSRVLSTCTVEVRDADDAVVRSLDCVHPYAAATVEWDGTDELGAAVPAGEYTWHVAGATGAEDLVDYDGGDAALSGELTVSGVAPPWATTVSPAGGARNVVQTANVNLVFSEDMSGVSGTTFQLHAPDGEQVPAAVTYNAAGMGATLNPSASLASDTEYTVTLTGGDTAIKGTDSGPLETTSWTFTTGPAPTLTKLTPATNGTAASPSGNLKAVFSEAVTGLSTDTFELATAGGDPVPGAVTYDAAAKAATFNPTANLLPDTRYTATLTGGSDAVRDIAGNPMTTRSWSFTTGPAPTVTGKLPAANATAVSRTGNIVAAFSEAVTGVSSSTVKLKTSSGTAGSATVSYSATTRKVTINPTGTLAAKTKYTVTLTGGATSIRDAAGNPLDATSWSFTTGS